jgi:DNA-binding MarR family transcriptional regulator
MENESLPIDHPDRRRLPPLLRKAWYSLNQTFRRRIAHLGITPDQFTAIRWLYEAKDEGLSQKLLTACMSSDPNTIAAMVARLEKAGLVERTVSQEDRRMYCVRLTKAGQTAHDEARPIAIALQHEILDNLSEQEAENFLASLEKIAAICQETLATDKQAQS